MKRMKTLSTMVFLTVLCQGNYAQQKETSDLSTIKLDDSVEVQKKIRLEKFDKILPRVMRDNNIDMWIHIIRPWTYDPLRFELGASEGVFIFTDLGLNGIERAAFSADVQDPMAYDIVIEEGMERESKPETPIEMDFRFVELKKFVLASIIGRGFRFLSIGILVYWYGEEVKSFIEDNFQLLTVLFGVVLILMVLIIGLAIRYKSKYSFPGFKRRS